MKRILKPVGHCLTTIAMTSAMLEAYPAAVEAATPRPPAPTESAPTTPSPAVPLADEAPPTPRVVPPERIGTVEKSSKSDSARAVSQRQVPAPSTHAAASHTALAQAAAAATDQNQPQTAARPAAVPPAAAQPPAASPAPAPATTPAVTEQTRPATAGTSAVAPTAEASMAEVTATERATVNEAPSSSIETTPTPATSAAPAGAPLHPSAIAPTHPTAPEQATPAEPTTAEASTASEQFANSEMPSLEFTAETVAVPSLDQSLDQLETAASSTDPLTGQSLDQPVIDQAAVAVTPTPVAVPVPTAPLAGTPSGTVATLQVPCIPLSPNFTAPPQPGAAGGSILARSQTVALPPPPVVSSLPSQAAAPPVANGPAGRPLPPLTALVPTAASASDFVARVPKPAADAPATLPMIALVPGHRSTVAPPPFLANPDVPANLDSAEQRQVATVDQGRGDRSPVSLPQKQQSSLLTEKPVVDLTADNLVSKNLNTVLEQVGITNLFKLPTLWPAVWDDSSTHPDGLMPQTQPAINLPAKMAISLAKHTVAPTWELAAIGQQLPSLRLSEGAAPSKPAIVTSDLPKVVVPAIAAPPRYSAVNVAASVTDCLTGTWARSFSAIAPDRLFSWGGLVFPLPIRVPLTSGFGWRIHPITGDRRIHAGVDLGAPQGTPVLAAKSGRVVAAEAIGGYGLTVVLEDEQTQRRTLYAHLSAIAVQPGATVAAGSVIGLVGSTGFSTGPHLHFEYQVRSASGWVAVDPLIAAAQLAQRRGIPANLEGGETRVAQGVAPRSRREE